MAIEFKINDFFFPLELWRLKTSLDKSQWLPADRLGEHQSRLLKTVVSHAYAHVPYYRQLFDKLDLTPSDIQNAGDLKKIPTLKKSDIKKNFKVLTADNAPQFLPRLCRTSGTTGEPVEFLQDKPSNILEFCYYWRYWSWAGYVLGSPFAELTLYHFLNTDINAVADHAPMTNRLMLNPAQLSLKNMDAYASAFKKYRPQFLKGSPSSVFVLASLLEKKGTGTLPLKAVFTTGELLLPHQRKKIESIFQSKVLDSYGQMERTTAICQCPLGHYHINSDYGVLEIDKGRVVGTSLYNFAMPLLRYELNDTIEIPAGGQACACGRGLPVCKNIIGRSQDALVTADGRFLTNVFILFDILQNVSWAQIVQDTVDKIRIRLVRDQDFCESNLQEFKRELRLLTGPRSEIDIEYLPETALSSLLLQKYKPVISSVQNQL
ncbi:MAG: phenylacetate--CoA ligase family protein [Candidatus Omnitrophica bacterium]|nr:phenylacetate--CoA ligase family protein [Candidatus Omnitrophota bacterium]